MKRFIFIVFTLFVCLYAEAQTKFTISGYVTDEKGENLMGANVIVSGLTKGTVTNNYGFYSLTLPQGSYKLQISYVGYEMQEKAINLTSNQKISISLKEAAEMLEAVEVTAEKRDANVKAVTMSTEKLDIKTIKKIPTLLGETDVIKVIQLQPGVQTVGEGNSGFFVRGGAVDQNLILLDEATVYNPAHLGGFFSVFNGDAISNVTLYKGGIPARYGGRLSSVLDVRMKEGNKQKFSATGGIGAISSRLTLESPLFDQKCSFVLSGRRTYYDLFFPFAKQEAVRESKSYFYDLNAKINYTINDNNRVYLSLYTGQDIARFGDIFQMQYGNKTATMRWNHVFTDKLFSNFMLVHSNFNYSLGQPTGSFAFDWTSNIIDYSFKNDNTYFINPNNTLSFGVQIIHHNILPGKFEPSEKSNFINMELPENSSVESAVFIGNEQKLNSRITLLYGLRYSMFNNTTGKIYSFDSEYNVIDSVDHKSFNFFNTFNGIEPRLAINVNSGPTSSVKVSYNRTYQYLHLATNTAASTPLDVWFSSNPNIKPQYADQVAAGYFRNFFDNMLEFSIEGYYKKMYDAVDFVDHASLTGNKYFDRELRRGEAFSYGIELYLRKQQGKFTGWISYTYSKTRRTIIGVNDGKEYPSPYDRPHDLKIVASYDITKRLNVSANWVYYTALPMTVATQWYQMQGIWVPVYSERNTYRFRTADYHRLDVALSWENRPVLNDKFKSSWTLSAYNVYNRHNLYSIVYEQNKNGGPPEIRKMYLFGIVPTITFNFNF